MEITVKQISSLEKVRRGDAPDHPTTDSRLALPGERVSYQLYLDANDQAIVHLKVKSQLADSVRIYRVREVMMDRPVVVPSPIEDYITHEPGLMPDVLIPLEESGMQIYLDKIPHTLWVKVDIPADTKPGNYPVELELSVVRPGGEYVETRCSTMDISVIDGVMPEQKLIYTKWMYLDCIATAHNVEIFSEQHWSLIEKYIQAARDVGINMLMVPVHTPPLDTEIGHTRPCVQLVDIEKTGDQYKFGLCAASIYCDERFFAPAHIQKLVNGNL